MAIRATPNTKGYFDIYRDTEQFTCLEIRASIVQPVIPNAGYYLFLGRINNGTWIFLKEGEFSKPSTLLENFIKDIKDLPPWVVYHASVPVADFHKDGFLMDLHKKLSTSDQLRKYSAPYSDDPSYCLQLIQELEVSGALKLPKEGTVLSTELGSVKSDDLLDDSLPAVTALRFLVGGIKRDIVVPEDMFEELIKAERQALLDNIPSHHQAEWKEVEVMNLQLEQDEW